MAFRQSPSFVASGAMGIVTGLAIAGGLVLALSLPAAADLAPATASPAIQAHITQVSMSQPDNERTNRSRSSETKDLRTFGNSTARAYAMREAGAEAHDLTPRENGELVASNDGSPAAGDPQN